MLASQHERKNTSAGNFFDHLGEVANTTSTLISPIVGADYCTVTIKLLWWTQEDTVVHSLLRDARSYRQRGAYQPTDYFGVHENTAFEQLVFARESTALFMSNNLRLAAAEGEYRNTNTRWRKFYNSTAVVRIDNPEPDGATMGFLCADAWSWDADAQRAPVQSVLSKLAQHVYNTLDLIVPENEDGQKHIGFRPRGESLEPIDEKFQTNFQNSLEKFHRNFDKEFYQREARDETRLLAASHPSRPTFPWETQMREDKELENMNRAAARTTRVKRVRAVLDMMSHQDRADILKPIADHNRYAGGLLANLRKKRLAK